MEMLWCSARRATSCTWPSPGMATSMPTSGATFPIGTTTVTCTATDSAGIAAVPTSFTVTVQDTTPPSVTVNFPPPSGNGGWFTSPTVTGSVTATDLSTVATIRCTVNG